MQSKFHENELRYKPPCLKFVTIKKSVIKPYWEEKKIMSDIFQNMSDIIQNISEIFFAVPNYQNKKADNSDIATQHSYIRNLSFHLLLSALFLFL